jgi:hypothetical protein
MSGHGGNNGIWRRPLGGGSKTAKSIFMKFDRETKRPVTTPEKYL